MGYTIKQLKIIELIMAGAEQEIFDRTGMQCRVLLCNSELNEISPKELINVVAAALEMNPEAVGYDTRKKEIVELRFICASLIRTVFKAKISYKAIGELFGGLDHTTVMNGITKCESHLENEDVEFTPKYKAALNAVNKWLAISSIDNV